MQYGRDKHVQAFIKHDYFLFTIVYVGLRKKIINFWTTCVFMVCDFFFVNNFKLVLPSLPTKGMNS